MDTEKKVIFEKLEHKGECHRCGKKTKWTIRFEGFPDNSPSYLCKKCRAKIMTQAAIESGII